jgi:hypothetical protein
MTAVGSDVAGETAPGAVADGWLVCGEPGKLHPAASRRKARTNSPGKYLNRKENRNRSGNMASLLKGKLDSRRTPSPKRLYTMLILFFLTLKSRDLFQAGKEIIYIYDLATHTAGITSFPEKPILLAG